MQIKDKVHCFFEQSKEEWKDIKGFEGIYQVSSCGRVCSSYKRGGTKRYYISNQFTLLKNVLYKNGYYFVTLRNNGIVKLCTVHRLVAENFIPNPSNLKDVNHKNGVKTDNNVENLEWCTRSYNIRHAFSIGLKRITDEQIRHAMRPVEIVFPNGGKKVVESVKEAAKIIGYSHYNSLYNAMKRGKFMNGFFARFVTKGQYDNSPIL